MTITQVLCANTECVRKYPGRVSLQESSLDFVTLPVCEAVLKTPDSGYRMNMEKKKLNTHMSVNSYKYKETDEVEPNLTAHISITYYYHLPQYSDSLRSHVQSEFSKSE